MSLTRPKTQSDLSSGPCPARPKPRSARICNPPDPLPSTACCIFGGCRGAPFPLWLPSRRRQSSTVGRRLPLLSAHLSSHLLSPLFLHQRKNRCLPSPPTPLLPKAAANTTTIVGQIPSHTDIAFTSAPGSSLPLCPWWLATACLANRRSSHGFGWPSVACPTTATTSASVCLDLGPSLSALSPLSTDSPPNPPSPLQHYFFFSTSRLPQLFSQIRHTQHNRSGPPPLAPRHRRLPCHTHKHHNNSLPLRPPSLSYLSLSHVISLSLSAHLSFSLFLSVHPSIQTTTATITTSPTTTADAADGRQPPLFLFIFSLSRFPLFFPVLLLSENPSPISLSSRMCVVFYFLISRGIN